MKSSVIFKLFLIVTVVFFSSCQEKKGSNSKPKTDITEFLGQWTIDIKGGSVGWLEVRQEDGYLDADLLWGGGSVLSVPYIYLSDNVLSIGRNPRKIVRKKDEMGIETRIHYFPTWVEAKRNSEKIEGILLTPHPSGLGVDTTLFTGTKLPPVPTAPDMANLKFGKPISLFNGKDLTGWKLRDEKLPTAFKVIDGVLVNDPDQKEGAARTRYTNIMTEQVFEDFNLKIEVNVPQGENSGIYLRGIYEVAIEQGHADSGGKELDAHNMGGIYSRISPTVNAERPAGTWQTLDITLCDRRITVILNGTKIIDNQPLYGPTGGAISSDVFAPGPIYLQGDHGKVSFRNIVLTPIIK